jgi:CheY-like chemotaxis protein
LRVLIAEDNVVNQRLAARLLEKQGHSVAVVDNGRAALTALAQQLFDLVLMDVQMPEMDGLETTAAIRAQEQGTGRHLPIIALTSHAMQGDQERCFAAGVDAYVSKPMKVDELFAAIDRLCSYEPDPGLPRDHLPNDRAPALKPVAGAKARRLSVQGGEALSPRERDTLFRP